MVRQTHHERIAPNDKDYASKRNNLNHELTVFLRNLTMKKLNHYKALLAILATL